MSHAGTGAAHVGGGVWGSFPAPASVSTPPEGMPAVPDDAPAVPLAAALGAPPAVASSVALPPQLTARSNSANLRMPQA